ncbi:uncharacterized protein LOC18422889 isoform X3 [Amborella trichopoda]|nr:uncharacterized protein LOC18422889 isoform X2 [Amborella trichopoda]XP_020526410.1 uncharacterized protein LOC18422889 isoform X3 [Amborella trichopoda]|eukprot:XP_006827653.2 uncharacterized protein LOC18422889 isoform X2 [Amborella trichopoda]
MIVPTNRKRERERMDPKTDKLVRRVAIVTTAVAAYFLLTQDYGPNPNALDPIKKAINSAEAVVKSYIFKSREEPRGKEGGDTSITHGKGQ